MLVTIPVTVGVSLAAIGIVNVAVAALTAAVGDGPLALNAGEGAAVLVGVETTALVAHGTVPEASTIGIAIDLTAVAEGALSVAGVEGGGAPLAAAVGGAHIV